METAAATATILAIKGLGLVAGGFCLGLGFWASKQLTNKLDERLLIYDKRKLLELGNIP